MNFALVIALLAPAPALAIPAATTQKDPNREICRRLPIPGEVVRKRKVCKTAAGWDAERRNARANIEALQDQGLINTCTTHDGRRC